MIKARCLQVTNFCLVSASISFSFSFFTQPKGKKLVLDSSCSSCHSGSTTSLFKAFKESKTNSMNISSEIEIEKFISENGMTIVDADGSVVDEEFE